eukprot:13194153-Alexandrium_andersonii.AAC.1
MSASLVGSEMCIRDRPEPSRELTAWETGTVPADHPPRPCESAQLLLGPVSYTHLTLPTICSV